MSTREIDLIGKVCPYLVMYIVREIDMMKSGESIIFLVDDPLANKSIPEELEEYDDISLQINKKDHTWEIFVAKN